MTENETHEWDGCLMCAVRALTEGRPREWVGTAEPGSTVTGVVLKMGTQPTAWGSGQAPYLDLWTGGVSRVRVAGHSTVLREALLAAEAQVGDTVTVTRHEDRANVKTQNTYRVFSVEIERGHH